MSHSQDVVREIMSMVPCKWKSAKKIWQLAREPIGTCRSIPKLGPSGRPLIMIQSEAADIVDRAEERMMLVDEGG